MNFKYCKIMLYVLLFVKNMWFKSIWMIDCFQVYSNVYVIIKRLLIFEAPCIVQVRLMPPKWRFRSPLLSPRVRVLRRLESHHSTWISASRGKFYWLIAVVLELQRSVSDSAADEKYGLYFIVIAGERTCGFLFAAFVSQTTSGHF